MTRRDELVARAKAITPHLINGAADMKKQEAAGYVIWELVEALAAQDVPAIIAQEGGE
jgi:hypothetical protein